MTIPKVGSKSIPYLKRLSEENGVNNTGKQGKVVHTLAFCSISLPVNIAKIACWGYPQSPVERPLRGAAARPCGRLKMSGQFTFVTAHFLFPAWPEQDLKACPHWLWLSAILAFLAGR